MRNDIARSNETSSETLESLYKYTAVLQQLQGKFPEDQIGFSWCQTISTKAHTREMYSIEWEKVNIYYNIAAMYSLLALLLPVSADNLNKQYQYYQIAATIFDQLSELSNKGNETAAIDGDTANSLKLLMLAQGMECFWFKAMKKEGGIKNTMAAKLTSQITKYYDEARVSAQKSPLIRNDWMRHMESKSRYFKAVTYYRLALNAQDDKQYGIVVKCLSETKSQLQKCNLELKDAFVKKVEALLADSIRDNDFIYLQVVPDDLPQTPAPLNMIKLLDFNTLIKQHTEKYMERRYFKTLLPLELIEACNAYNERQDQFVVEQIRTPIMDFNEKLRTLDAQKSLENGKLEVVTVNELSSLDVTLESMRTNNNYISSQLEFIERILNDEADTDKTLRAQYGTLRWELPESNTLNQGFRDRLQALKQYLAKGVEIDKDATELYSTVDRALLTNSTSQIPEKDDPLSVKVRDTSSKRDIFLAKVDAKSMSHRILKTLIDTYRESGEKVNQSAFEAKFQEHMTIFNEDLGRVREERRLNEDLLQELSSEEHTHVDDTPASDHRFTKRELYMVDFNHSLGLLHTVKDTAEQGIQFYRDLIASTNSLLVDVETFAEKRKTEKQQLSEQLSS